MLALKNVHTSSGKTQPQKAAAESSGAGHFFLGQPRGGALMYSSRGCRGEERSLQLPVQHGLPAWPGSSAPHGRQSSVTAVLCVCPELDVRRPS